MEAFTIAFRDFGQTLSEMLKVVKGRKIYFMQCHDCFKEYW